MLFLDIEMPGKTGLEVAQFANGHCHIVFVTAYDNYAVEAFEHAAVDYVMKPITAERLAETVRRLKVRTHERPPDLAAVLQLLAERLLPSREYLRWITVSEGQEMRLITLDGVLYYFQSDTKYTRVVTPEKCALIGRFDQGTGRGGRPQGLLADPPQIVESTSIRSAASRATSEDSCASGSSNVKRRCR